MSELHNDGIVAPNVPPYTMSEHGERPNERRPSFAAIAGEVKLATDKSIINRKSQEALNHLNEKDIEQRDPKQAKKSKTKSKKDNNDELKKELNMTEHTEELSSLLARLNTDANLGLKEDKYKEAYQKFGPNKMTPPPTTPEWVKFLKEISSGFALLLWAGGILCFISYGLQRNESDLYLGIVLCAVVLITGVFSYCQGRQSSALMDSFKQMMADQATVIRNGKTFVAGADTLVPGDIILMKGGEKVPADVRIIDCSDDMQVDNACLTGESEPCKRSTEAHHENPLEADNLAFFGTQIPKGRATGVVVQTGDHTVMGRIAKLAVATETEETPIARELAHFIMIISIVAITLGVIFFVVGLIIGTPIVSNLVFMIGIIVANVPEGLLATVTVCLTLTANRMYLKNVLVKNLEGVETLGSTTCICSDKTGTLTQNMMTVTNLMYDTHIYDCECSLYDKSTTNKDSTCFKKLMRCATICNKAKWDENSMLKHDEKGNIVYENGKEVKQPFILEVKLGNVVEKKIQWKPIGDASENALIKYVQGFSGITDNIEDYRNDYPLIKEIPFNSTNKYQLSINRQPGKPNHLVTMKGAPERIVGRCNKYYDNDGNLQDLTPEKVSEIEKLQIELSKRGLRVLGFAELELDDNKYKDDYPYKTDKPNFPLGECWDCPDKINEQLYDKDHCATPLNFIGMTAMIDPPRPQVPGAVAKCKTAGIRVIMVTGDHPITAKAISKKVGIIWTETEDELVEINRKNGFYDEKNPKPRTAENGYREPALADAVVVPGSDFGVDTPDDVWDDILQHTQVVFARTSPQQKLLIVENCQKREEIVAVTGDGVNDAPALRKADIGVAMGIMGSAVSKDAADMILLDDNFASIVQGVEEGRLIFDNLKKSIAYTLSSNIPEIFPFLAFITVGIPLPLSTVTILCIDLGTDMVPAISLAWEEPESDIMRRPPRYAKTDHLVTGKLIFFAYLQIGMSQCMCAFLTYLIVMDDYGYPPKILMRAGANDNWGKQTLYCSFKDGVFRNITGDEYIKKIDWTKEGKEIVDQIHEAYQDGYWFYDPGHSQKDLDTCLFATRNYDSSNSKQSGYERFFNVSSYGNGYTQVTDTSIEALYKRGMVEYYPYRSAKSIFWNQNWLQWDVEDSSVDGLGRDGKGPKDPVTYTYQPYGVYKVLSANQNGKNAIGMKNSNDGITFGDDDSVNKNKCFTNATLSFGDHTDLNRYIFPENTIKIGEGRANIRLNVASRMCQKEALAHAQSSYFVSIVVVQWSDLLISKTRMNSISEQGMRNSAMNFGIIFETWLAMMLCYIPPFCTAFGTRPLRMLHWCAPLPWFMLIILYDETRKFCMRKSVVMYEDKNTHQIFREPKWVERNTYY